MRFFLHLIPGRKLESARLELLKVLKTRENEIRRGRLVTNQGLPKYLFFSDLLSRVLYWSQSYGGQATDLIKEIRICIIKEGQSQRKIAKEINESLTQMIIVTITIWGFVYFSKSFVAGNTQNVIYLKMASMHLLGVAFLMIAQRVVRKRVFIGYPELYQSLYGVYCLQKVGLSFQACLREIPLSEVWQLPKKFSPIKLELEDLLASWKKGVPPSQGLKWLLEEVDFLFTQDLEKSQRAQALQKFLTLSFFYLPSYFIYLGSLFQGLMVT